MLLFVVLILLRKRENIEDFNKCMHNGTFPKGFKIHEVIPVYKKHEPYDKQLPTHKYTFTSVQNL